eukprot:gene4186-2985_t
MFSSLLVILLVALAGVALRAEDVDYTETPTAKLVVYKHSHTNPVVEGMDFVITYQLVNLGNAAATNIELVDRYDPNSFETIGNFDDEGMLSQNFEEIAPGAQASFNVTIRPKLFGIYESTRARLRYNPSVQVDGVEADLKQAQSTSLGRVRIISKQEFSRNWQYFATHWTIYAVLAVLPVFIPLFSWSSTTNSVYSLASKSD